MSAQFKSYIEERVNTKGIDHQRDNTSVSGFLRNRNGDKFYFSGTTEIADIEFSSGADGEKAVITIPWNGHYRRKHYIGIQDEFRSEDKDIRGKYRVSLTLGIFDSNLDDIGIIESGGNVTDPNHEAHQSAKLAIQEDILPRLRQR